MWERGGGGRGEEVERGGRGGFRVRERGGGGRGREGEGKGQVQYIPSIPGLTFSNMAIFLSRERGNMIVTMVTTLMSDVLIAQLHGSTSPTTTRETPLVSTSPSYHTCREPL